MQNSATASQTVIIQGWLGAGSINLFGYPFAGKDTQGELLADMFGTKLLGGGEILRNSIIPARAKRIMDAGGLIPTEDYLQIVLPYLSQDDFKSKPLILSSVGRWSGEEQGVIVATSEAGHPLRAVISLNLDEAVIWQRWQALEKAAHHSRGQRYDDAADKIERRFEEFRVKTLPVIAFYRELDLVIDIDSDRPIETVHQDILDKLASRASASP